jgi:5-methylcytosine-specific restriction endonuclease McrA
MTKSQSQPSAADQLLFLSQVQRLLDSGRFSATYKFALFLTLAEIAVEQGDDSGDRMRIPLEAIAARFLMLYWRQAAPYPATGVDAVLLQNSGKNAEIITRIAKAHRSLGPSLGVARSRPEWLGLVRDAKRIVVKMPLLKLQTIGEDGKATRAECFLYRNTITGDAIELLPGVAFCLRRFFPLLQGMVRSKWLSWVQGQNRNVLGSVQDLESFMFGADRSETRGVRTALFEMQGGRCFYQPRVRLDLKTAHVDHFIPWAKYPCDAAANLVLASPKANAGKKDRLAATEYLGRWRDRNEIHRDHLVDIAGDAGLEFGTIAVERVATWAYGIHEGIGGLVWHASDGLVQLDPGWRKILSA